MEATISIHDCEIQSYEVSIENAEIIFHTTYDGFNIHKNTTITFHDVLTHYFEHVCYQNVIFDIMDTETEDFLKEYSQLLNDNKNYSWPIEYKNESELKSYLESNSYIIYNIDSSIGLTGFVIAKSIEVQSL